MEEIILRIISGLELTGTIISESQLEVHDRGVPHNPTSLPKDKMGIYAFIYKDEYLKVGKAGQKSGARFLSQHYSPSSSASNLASSILSDPAFSNKGLNKDNIGKWIKQNVRREDYLIDASLGIFVLNYIEAFLHLLYKPKYEGFNSQR